MANIVRRPENIPVRHTAERGASDPLRMISDLLRWDPFREMLPVGFPEEMPVRFVPDFEVKETPDSYVFKADLPGIREEDLDITMTGNRLTVSGKREAEHRVEDERYFTYERSYGTFTRSFTLPEGVDEDHIHADLKDGVLSMVVPKMAEHKPRKISLKGAVDKIKGALGGEKKDAKA